MKSDKITKPEKLSLVMTTLILMILVFLFLNTEITANYFSQSSDAFKFAKIDFLKGDVRRKYAADEVWSPLNFYDETFVGDEIYTGPTAQLVMRISPTLLIRSEPETRISLGKINQIPIVNTDYGAYQVQANNDDQIRLGLGLKPASVRALASSRFFVVHQDQQLHLEVTTGTVSVNGRLVKTNQKVSIDQNGSVGEVEERSIATLVPLQNQEIWYLRDRVVRFEWKKTVHRNYRLIVSQDPYFARPIWQGKLQNQEFAETRLPASGRYFWRVEDVANPLLQSTVQAFNLLHETPPELIYPKQNMAVVIDAKSSIPHLADLVFNFSHSNPSQDYVLEVSHDESFNATTAQWKTSSMYISEISLPKGNYYWRVKSHDKRRSKAVWSEVRRFSVHDTSEELAKPHLLSAEVKNFDQNQVANKTAHILFDRVVGAKKYNFELIHQDAKIKKIVTQSSPTLILPESRPGVYLVRAQAIGYQSILSDWSSTAVAIVHGQLQPSVQDQK